MHLISMQFYTPRLGSSGSCNLRGLTVEKVSTYAEPEGSFLTRLCKITKAALRCGNAKLDSGCDPSRDLKLRVQGQQLTVA